MPAPKPEPSTTIVTAATTPAPVVMTPGGTNDFLLPIQTATPEPNLTPQIFLKYFNHPSTSTNSVIGITAPMGFTPPWVTEPPSSKATYSTGP
jgi:hypothetical protein